jgi:hypothetical protein
MAPRIVAEDDAARATLMHGDWRSADDLRGLKPGQFRLRQRSQLAQHLARRVAEQWPIISITTRHFIPPPPVPRPGRP